MSAPGAALIELALVFGAVLAFGFWELNSLRRDRKRSQEARKRPRTGGDGEDAGNGGGAGG